MKKIDKPNPVYRYDYMCMKKCIFQKRLHKMGEVYVFNSDMELPEHFTKMGLHKELVATNYPAQIKVLKGKIKFLEEQVVKVTAEKDNLKSDLLASKKDKIKE